MSDRTSEVTPPPLFRRYRQVARVLVRHGFVDVVDALGLGRYLSVGARLLPKALRPAPSQPKAVRLRLACEQLGPTFVKFGQALSVRSDVLPPEVTAELARLQDRVPPLAAGEAEAVIEAELGRPVTALFRSFDSAPLAAASIAQVHRAVLPTGDAVVVKVRRPGIGPLIASDLAILHQLAALAERHLPGADVIDPSSLVDEFARTIRAEQDLVREGRNVERCAGNFEQEATVRIPRVHWSHTTSAVLTMEWLDGEQVSASRWASRGRAGCDAPASPSRRGHQVGDESGILLGRGRSVVCQQLRQLAAPALDVASRAQIPEHVLGGVAGTAPGVEERGVRAGGAVRRRWTRIGQPGCGGF